MLSGLSRWTGITVLTLGLAAGCSRQESISPTGPSALGSASTLGALADAPVPEALPLGSVSAGETACPPGSQAGTGCARLIVDCPTITPASALLRVTRPATATTNRGTILLSTGGFGTTLNGNIPLGAQMFRAFGADGLSVVEIAWDAPGIWGGPQARTLACRYATAARWVYENIHARGAETLFAVQGTSGGSSQIAFALAHYGLSDIIELANLGSGPVGCPQCSPDGRHGPEPLLPGAPPSVNRVPQFVYPTTTVRFFVGANEPTASIIGEANAYYDSVMAVDKSMSIVPGTPHDIESTDAGVRAFVESVHLALARRPRVNE